MEIFKLFGSIFVDNEKADKAIDDTNRKAEGLSGTFGNLGQGAKVLGGAIVAGIGVAVTAVTGLVMAGDDLQKALNDLQTQTGSTNDQMKGMEDSLINIYKGNYGESFGDIAHSMSLIRQATGKSGKELEKMTERAIMMRDTFGFEVNESIRTVDKMMKNFGITSDEAFTLLAQGQQKGLNMSDDMLDTFTEYSPVFKQLGFDAEGMFNLLADGAANGVRNTDVLADAIKEFGIRVKDDSKLTAESFAGLGLNANKMEKEFAKGGESAQKAFEKTMAALAKIEDPVKRNTIGVGLFGTKFEDLEHEAVLSLGNVEKVADKTADTLEKIDQVKYNSIGEAIQGIWRTFNASVLIPLEQKAMPKINGFIDTTKPLLEGVISLFQGNSIPLIDAITQGFSEEKQKPMINFFLGLRDGIQKVKTFVQEMIPVWTNGFNTILNVARPIMDLVLSKVMEVVSMIVQWWNTNGQQLLSNVKIVFDGIWSIIQFIMPAILLLVSSVLENVKGVISGALNIIMGIFQIFAGLFTGNWSKMWDGVKNLLGGALQFLWNLFNLMMIGKLIGGIKAFISSGLGLFKSFGSATVGTFKSFIDNIISWFSYFRQTGSSIWRATFDVIKNLVQIFKNSVSTNFNNILSTAKTVFGNVKNAILHPIQTAKNQVKGFIDEIKGFFRNLKLKLPDIKTPHFKLKNWSKNPLDWLKAMPSIDISWFARGTNYAPGGLAVVGEHGPELMHLPEGSRIDTASQTRSMLNKEQQQPIIIQPAPIYLDNQLVGEILFDQIDDMMNANAELSLYMKGERR